VSLRSRSCIVDGEAVACDDDGIALFERIRYRRHDASVFMWAFDIIELNGDDLRREPLERRKAALERVLGRAGHGVQLNEHLEPEGPVVFEHACQYGPGRDRVEAQGLVVSVRPLAGLGEGEEPQGAPAVTRLAEENWGRS
jgi:hypothetical protein